ncbi:Hypothetical protein, putative [Bodo saltans]|uniref:Uncharacterized protein n=1 Tax=Bodo saltans TaxID=75058 RepID=A0A0S4IHE6_BODSA|nr:Hypothetical protein, putative [Bodo saltans]|eukprot:CUE64459.1 Hypothetical protein, putative [Bodo saltans]
MHYKFLKETTLTMQSSSAAVDEKISAVIGHLVSLKDIIASGLRCPALVTASLERVPREQRAAVVEMDKQLRALLSTAEIRAASSASEAMLSPPGNNNNNGALSKSSSVVASTPQRRSAAPAAASTANDDDDELVMDSGPSLMSPPTPKQRGNGAAADDAITPHHQSSSTTSPLSPLSPGVSSGSTTTANAVAGSDNKKSVSSLFRVAFLGSSDTPQAIGNERIPKPLTTGLVHGNEGPMRALLLQHKSTLLDGLLQLLEGNGGEMHEALSNSNMLWLQRHPADFQAQAIEASRMNAFVKSAAARAASLKRKEAGGGEIGGNGEGPTLVSSASAASSSSRGTADSNVEGTLRQLLFLNLQLKYPAEQWAPLLHIRDDTLSTIRSYRTEYDNAILHAKVAVSCFPSLVRLYNALDTVLTSLSHLNIYASPVDIQDLMLERCTNALVEAQVVQHDHQDVARHAAVLRAVEDCAAHVIDCMKIALRDLCEVPVPPSSESS